MTAIDHVHGGSPSPNGIKPADKGAEAGREDVQILRALELIHDPRSSNVLRQDASRYLEQTRSQDEAPYYGYNLAAHKSHPHIVQHYGLSLLEYAIQHRWTEYSEEQSMALRDWTLRLAQGVTEQDPLFIRNKVAQLWVDIAKRSWGLEWMDMDEMLVQLWSGSLTQKELVLMVLETLSDDCFGREDITSGLRGNELNRACVDIFTPASTLLEHFPKREASVTLRYGDEGWVSRISDSLGWCNSIVHAGAELQSYTCRILSTLRSVAAWVILRALTVTRCVPHICQSLLSHNEQVQLAAIEALHAIYNRPRFSDDDIRDLALPMYEPNTVDLLKRVYASSIVDFQSIDPDRYLLSKKFSEMMHNVGGFLGEKPMLFPKDANLANFFDLLLDILQHPSLHVSIPIVHLWAKILDSDMIGNSPPVMSRIGPLLEICGQRLLRYEALPEDSDLPTIVFLNEDVDVLPERHAFLGNYARFCNQVVQSVVAKQPFDALHHILGQADQVINTLREGQPAIDVRQYAKVSIPALKLDAQFSIIEAALKGYTRWLSLHKTNETDALRESMNSDLRDWCSRLMGTGFEDPSIKLRIVQSVVEFANGPLKRDASFKLKVFDHIVNTRAVRQPDAELYNDAVKELQSFCVYKLQRLAIRSPDDFLTSYDYIKRKIEILCDDCDLDEADRIRSSSVLFIITQRAVELDSFNREQRLRSFVQPVVQRWQDLQATGSVASFQGFCDMLGLGTLQQYFLSRMVYEVADWPSQPLDEEGKALQIRMNSALTNLPLHATKTFLGMSVEGVQYGSPQHNVARTIWSDALPTILSVLLQFIGNAHSFHNEANWSDLPPEIRGNIVTRVLTDRFWQVGISSGSRDDFYARVGGSKTSMEGLASSVRAAMRTVRETSYRLLFHMSLLGPDFYMYNELSEPLSKALFENSCALSAHQTSMLVDTIAPIIFNCPSSRRSQFLTPILSAMFTQLDQKVSSEWEKIEERSKADSVGDSLAEEMRDESILRQLTYTSVTLVVSMLDPVRTNYFEDSAHGPSQNEQSLKSPSTETSLRNFILENPEVLKPLILFCTHALRMHDTRSCGLITRVLRTLIPEFHDSTTMAADVREFISTEVFRACITSIHDPYFVDTQYDLAGLMASIVMHYSSATDTPREILLSLPEMSADRVDSLLQRLYKSHHNDRQQKAIILKFLEGLRGISVSEQGKLPKLDSKRTRSTMQEQYMTVDMESNSRKEKSPDLGGIATMFG